MAQDLRRQIDTAASAGRKVVRCARLVVCSTVGSKCTCPLHQLLCVRARCIKNWTNSVCVCRMNVPMMLLRVNPALLDVELKA